MSSLSSPTMIPLDVLLALPTAAEFLAHLGGIYEKSPTFIEQFYTENLAPPPTTRPPSKLPKHGLPVLKFYSMKSSNTSGAAHPRFNWSYCAAIRIYASN
eukprot:scaffold14689_cov73-Skeletonema_marinoi.AAC.1